MSSNSSSTLPLIVWHFIRTKYEEQGNGINVPMALKYLIIKFSQKIISSKVLTINEDIKFIELLQSKLRNIKEIKFLLLYRGSENEYCSLKFHELCDNHGPTLTIIKNEFNHIFGGYSSINWSSDGVIKRDENAFLYLLRSSCELEDCPVLFQCINTNNAIIHKLQFGPSFGNGYDIKIVDKCNIYTNISYDTEQYGNSHIFSKNNNFILKNSYLYSGNQICGGTQKVDGYYHFKVLEYEVFELQQ